MKKHTVDLAVRVRGTYDQVPAILRLDFDDIIREPLEELRVKVGRSSVGRRVDARVGAPRAVRSPRGLAPCSLEIPLHWSAADQPKLFPTMSGRLRIARSGADMIELRLVGEYRPPLGAVGAVAHRFAGQRAATASLRAYLVDVGRRLEATITRHTPAKPTRAFTGRIERSP
jgi:hypothetical protein